MNWIHASYAFIAACIDYKTLNTEIAPCLHPDAHDALRFLLAVVQKYKQLPSYDHYKARLNLDLNLYRMPGFSVQEIADTVRRYYREDTVQQLQAELQASIGQEGVDISYVQEALRRFRTDMASADDAKVWRLSDFNKIIQKYATGQQAVAMFGSPRMDSLTGGIFPGQYIVVYANTSEMKSTFTRWFAGNMAAAGKTVLYISLEEPGDRSIIKTASTIFQYSARGVLRGTVPPHLLQTHISLPGDIIFIDDMKQRNTDALLALQERYKPDIIMLDQIPLFTKNFDQDWKVMSQTSRDLKYHAHINGTPIIALTQATRKNKTAKLDEMGFAYAMAQDADVVAYLHPTDKDFPTQKKLTFLKMRDGTRYVDVDFYVDLELGILREEEYVSVNPGTLIEAVTQTPGQLYTV